ncbi:sulfotransferase family 2 domain-containing protein [Brevibacillus centrosporus]|uniref:sulfotransferase family 2 domain-containing protein n=1 Tax=Brevibacillus centrosporus TaxID=54910 RepID=UPI003809DBA4
MLFIFLHLPKTAGTSMNTLLVEQFGQDHVAFLHEGNPWSTERLVRLCNVADSPILAISGHFPFGIHQLIDRPCTYFTFLRDPVEMLVSMYYYIRRTPVVPTHEKVLNMSFREFAESPDMEHLTMNLQTKYVTGMPSRFEHQTGYQYLSWDPGPYTPDLALAKDHLERFFSFVGITERFHESLSRLAKVLGWKKDVPLIYENVTPNRPQIPELDPGAIQLLTQKNQSDIQLYAYAKTMYHRNTF